MQTKIQGIELTIKKLAMLGQELSVKELRPIVGKAGAKIKDTMQQLAPERTGRLSRSIKVKGGKFAFVLIGPDFAPDGQGTITIPALTSIIEHGSRDRFPKKKKYLIFRNENGQWVRTASTRGVSARPFIIPSFERNKDAVYDMIQQDVIKLVKRKAKKLNIQ